MIQPTKAQVSAALDAACKAARHAIEDYSSFYSGMVSDDALRKVVDGALSAALPVLFSPSPPPPQNSKGPSQ